MLVKGGAHAFPLVDRYTGIRLGLDLSQCFTGKTAIVETTRRLLREQSYGFIHALWWVWLEDGRSAVSALPGVSEEVARIVCAVKDAKELFAPKLAEQLQIPVNRALAESDLGCVNRVLCDVTFACNGSLLRRHDNGDCRKFKGEEIPAADGLALPLHCFPDGTVYGVVADGQVVSVAFAHCSGVMEDQVADLGVVTAPAYRQRGYAKTVVSAVVEHIAQTGGEARYGCAPENLASIATARSVGFVPYASSLVLSVLSTSTSDAG